VTQGNCLKYSLTSDYVMWSFSNNMPCRLYACSTGFPTDAFYDVLAILP